VRHDSATWLPLQPIIRVSRYTLRQRGVQNMRQPRYSPLSHSPDFGRASSTLTLNIILLACRTQSLATLQQANMSHLAIDLKQQPSNRSLWIPVPGDEHPDAADNDNYDGQAAQETHNTPLLRPRKEHNQLLATNQAASCRHSNSSSSSEISANRQIEAVVPEQPSNCTSSAIAKSRNICCLKLTFWQLISMKANHPYLPCGYHTP
jgi:hypothetical protein